MRGREGGATLIGQVVERGLAFHPQVDVHPSALVQGGEAGEVGLRCWMTETGVRL